VSQVNDKLKAIMHGQNLVESEYHGGNSSEPVWLAYNQQIVGGNSVLGPHGTAELLDALEALYPGRNFPRIWNAAALHELDREMGQVVISPDRTRVVRVIESLVVAQKTISLLRSFMVTKLNTPGLRRALAVLGGPGGSLMTAAVDMPSITEVDAVEHVALAFPRAEGDCRAQMARFVVELADDAGLDLNSLDLLEWATKINASVAFNDAVNTRRRRRAERRLRLIVSLHYARPKDWPEALGVWLLDGDRVYHPDDFRCTPSQSGTEEALAKAVAWAEKRADALQATLRRIEVAAPAWILPRWRPEEVRYGPRLGVNYDVVTRSSLRLDPPAAMRWINSNARRALAEISATNEGSRLQWLGAQQASEPARLCEQFEEGRYTRAIGLMDDPRGNDGIFELVLPFAPILVWPQTASLTPEHCRRVDTCWHLLPEGFLMAYRARWRDDNADLLRISERSGMTRTGWNSAAVSRSARRMTKECLMAWGSYYRGDGTVHEVRLGPPPPWRQFPRSPLGLKFQPPKGLADTVNAALSLRRPLLVTGAPGSGKSTVIESVAQELNLGQVLRWHITSRSVLTEALYRYDVLGRIHEQQLKKAAESAEMVDDIAPFLRLGPLGTALVPADRPRALLIDEIDKSDLDLPSDLLDVLERGEYEIAELSRYSVPQVLVRMWDSEETHTVERGKIQCTEFPFIVMTSNEERDFPAAFLRRCIRFSMPEPDEETIRKIVRAHLEMEVPPNGPIAELVTQFTRRLQAHENLAIDQLLSAVFVLSGDGVPDETHRSELVKILLRELSRA
jgi:MoxR-like ATPase